MAAAPTAIIPAETAAPAVAAPDAPAAAAAAEPAPPVAGAPGRSRDNPVMASLMARRMLNKAGSEKETWHVEFDLSASGLDYAVGDAFGLFPPGALEADPFRYVREVDEDLEPGKTSIEGVFVAGTASAIRDIPDTILHSGAAATQVASWLQRKRAMR